MKNKKGKWEWDYNAQIIVGEYKGIILTSHITNNPSDHHERIPLMGQVKSNFTGIFDEMNSNFQVSTDNGYSTDPMQNILKKTALMEKYPYGNSQEKKNTKHPKNSLEKTNSPMTMK